MDYLPVGKPNSYKDYELIYYINDVTIANEEVLVEYGANGTATGTYEYGLQRLSVEYVNEAKEYYLYNGTGNVTQTTVQNGSMFLRYTYDPFGNVESINAPMTVDIDDLNRYTYNGEDYDFNTGLQYLRARYYNTSTGSFISQDTYLGQIINPISRNRYTYAHNSPVVFDDPSGHTVISNLLSGTITTVSNIGKTVYTGISTALKSVSNTTNTLISTVSNMAKNASHNKSCDDMPWYEKALNGLGGLAFSASRNFLTGHLAPLILLTDFLKGTDKYSDYNKWIAGVERSIVSNYVTNETWFYGGEVAGDVVSAYLGLFEAIIGVTTIVGGITITPAGALASATGVGILIGGVAITISAAAVAIGTIYGVGGASTVAYSFINMSEDIDKYANSLDNSKKLM